MKEIKKFIANFKQSVAANPKAAKTLLKAVFGYVAIYVGIGFVLTYYNISTETVQNYFIQFGAFSIVIFLVGILLVALTPLPDSPVIAAGVLILGIPLAFLSIWSGMVLASIINFYVARYLGREFVARNYPQTTKYIDMFASHSGFDAMIAGRSFTFVTFDLVSYAAGLTNMSVWKYLVAAVLGILPVAINYTVIGAGIASQNIGGVLISIVVCGALAVFLGIMTRTWRKRFAKINAEMPKLEEPPII